MFERVSNKLIQSQKSNMREDEVAIYQYGYYLLFEIALNLSLGLICGILLHAVNKVFLFWIIYIPLRKYCGMHLEIGCVRLFPQLFWLWQSFGVDIILVCLTL